MKLRHLLLEEDKGDGNAFMGGGAGADTSGAGTTDDGGESGDDGSNGKAGDDHGASSGKQATPDIDYKYPAGLDESYHGNPTLLKYANKDGEFDMAQVSKALIHATSQVGADKVVVPNKNFTDDEWKEFNTKIGVPADIKDYNIDPNVPEGMENNEEVFNNFKQLAHETGLRPQQAQKILDFYNNASKEGATAQHEEYISKVAANQNTLKEEWGNGFEKNMDMCNQSLRHFFPEAADQQAIVETGFLDTVVGTKLFHKLAKGLSEEHFTPQGQGTFGATTDELDSSITKLSSELLAIGKQHPNYNAKLKQYQEALDKRHSTKPVGMSARG